MTNFPDDLDSLVDPILGNPLSLSNGKTQPQYIKDLNDPVEELEKILVGPAFKNPKAATAAPAVTLANCTSLTADGPLSPAGAWSSYGQYGTTGAARSIVSGTVQAVFSGPNDGWLVYNLGADYMIGNAVALLFNAYHTRNPDLANRNLRENLDVTVSDAAITGVSPATNALTTVGNTVTSSPNGSIGDGNTGTITVSLGDLTKIRAIAWYVHDIQDYTTVTFRVSGLVVRARTELESAIGAGATLVPETYAPSGTQDQTWPLGHAGSSAIDLRPGYQIIYNYGGEHHVREIQSTGIEDGSVVADDILRRLFYSLKPHDKLVFPPNGMYRVEDGVYLQGLRDIEIDFNGATFYKDAAGAAVGAAGLTFKSCNRMKLHGFRFFGYHSNTYTGDEWTAVTGTSVVGTTRRFSAQNDFATRWPSVQSEAKYIARDKDGYYSMSITLSDTTHVAKDCRVSLKTEGGTVLAWRDLTLTATPTAYTIKFLVSRSLHDPMYWTVKKMTATANTITLTTSTMYGTAGNVGGGLPWETQQPITINGQSNDIELYDWHAEGATSYAFHLNCDAGHGQDIHIHDFTARCIAVQGIGLVQATGPVRVDRFAITEIQGHGIDVEPNTINNHMLGLSVTNGYIRNCALSAFIIGKWWQCQDLHVDNLKIINCGSFGGFGIGAIGGSVTNVDASSGVPASSIDVFGPYSDLTITGANMHWSNIHLSRPFSVLAGAGNNLYSGLHEEDWIDGGKVRDVEAGNNVIENIFIDGGKSTWDANAATLEGGAIGTFVVQESGGGANLIRDVHFASQAPLVFDPTATAQFAVMSGASPEWHGLEATPWQRAAPHVFRASTVGTPAFYPGGTQAFSQPVYDVQALSGAVATPVQWIPADTIVAEAAVAGTPVTAYGPAVAVAPDGVCEFVCEATSLTNYFATPLSGVYYGVAFLFEGSMDNVTWYAMGGMPQLRYTGYRRGRIYTGAFKYIRLKIQNYSVYTDARVSAIGNWTGSRGTNLRMLGVPVTAAATTLAATFPNRTVPIKRVWAAAATTGGTLAAGAYTYRVGLRGPHNGAGPPDGGRVATVSASGAVNLTADTDTPDAAGWYANSYTFFRKNPGDANYLWRCDLIPFMPLANHHPLSSLPFRDYGAYVGPSAFVSGYPTQTPWVAIGGGGYSSAALDTHDESGWEPDTNYGVQVTTSWLTNVAVPTKRVDGPDVTFGTAAPGGGGFADLEFVR